MKPIPSALSDRADDYLTKPFSMRELVAPAAGSAPQAFQPGAGAPGDGQGITIDFGPEPDLSGRRPYLLTAPGI